MITESVMLSVYTNLEVLHMKYENPTCEVVLIDSADCTQTSGAQIVVNDQDTPLVDYVPTY